MKNVLDRVMVFVNRRLCNHRHTIRRTTPNRVYLECVNCPWESPGFIIKE